MSHMVCMNVLHIDRTPHWQNQNAWLFCSNYYSY